MANMKKILDEIAEEMENMSNGEFQIAMEEAECDDICCILEYAQNPFLEEYAQWRVCYRHMWE